MKNTLWFEVYIDQGEEGTMTVAQAESLKEAMEQRSEYIKLGLHKDEPNVMVLIDMWAIVNNTPTPIGHIGLN